jgi:hypothetical protein
VRRNESNRRWQRKREMHDIYVYTHVRAKCVERNRGDVSYREEGIARGMRLYHIAPILLSIPPVGRYLLRSLFFLRTAEQKEITRARHPFYSAKVSAPIVSSRFLLFLFLAPPYPFSPFPISLSLFLCSPGFPFRLVSRLFFYVTI